jgi:GNAT superfamily N-acetyltransferase
MSEYFSLTYQNPSSDHFPELLLLEDICFRYDQPHRKKLVFMNCRPNGHCFCAYLEDRPVGYVLLSFSPSGKSATIHALAVHPRLRQQAIGSNLVQKALLEASKSGSRQVICDVSTVNTDTYDLFLKAGFAISIDEPVSLPDPLSGLRLVKNIKENTGSIVAFSDKHEVELNDFNVDYFRILKAC